MRTKYCTKCKKDVPTGAFGRNRRNNDGLASYCRLCANEIAAEHKKKNPMDIRQNPRCSESDIVQLYMRGYTNRRMAKFLDVSRSYIDRWVRTNNLKPNIDMKNVVPDFDRELTNTECYCYLVGYYEQGLSFKRIAQDHNRRHNFVEENMNKYAQSHPDMVTKCKQKGERRKQGRFKIVFDPADERGLHLHQMRG